MLALLLSACSDDATADAGAPDAGGLDAGGGADAALPDAAGGDTGPTLYLYYPLDGDAIEAGGSGKDGIGSGVSAVADRFGVAAHALHVDGAQSVVTVSSIELRPPFSVSLWFDRTGHGAADPGCLGGEVSAVIFAGYRFLLDVEPDETKLAYAIDNEPAPPLLQKALTTDNPAAGWHHLVLVDRVTEGELWIDGVQVKTGTVADTGRHASFLTLGGHPSWPCGLQGALDEVRVFHGALDADAIGSLFHQ